MVEDYLKIYNAVRNVPPEAKKEITGGRLKGMTDINPMWRIFALTEQFGPCGIGWKYVIREKRMEPGAKDCIAAFVDVDLYIKLNGEWSDAIPGTGGASFVSQERNGLYTSDECFKMALTDAISVACKALGFGADVYWANGKSKYNSSRNETPLEEPKPPIEPGPTEDIFCVLCKKNIIPVKRKDGHMWLVKDIAAFGMKYYNGTFCAECLKILDKQRKDRLNAQ